MLDKFRSGGGVLRRLVRALRSWRTVRVGSFDGGRVDALEIEPSGLVRVLGTETREGGLGAGVEVAAGGRTLQPLAVCATRSGVCAEYAVDGGAAFVVRVGGATVFEGRSPSKGPPPYARLRTAEGVLHRGDIYGSGPPVDVVDPEVWEHCRDLPAPVLDFGCGAGALVKRLREAGRDARGIDVAIGAVEEYLSVYDGRLPTAFPDGAFASVTCVEVLEHIEDFEAAVHEIARLARERVFVTVPDISAIPLLAPHGVVPWHLLEATHVNFFAPRSLAALLAPLFSRVRLVRVGRNVVNGTAYWTSVGALCWK